VWVFDICTNLGGQERYMCVLSRHRGCSSLMPCSTTLVVCLCRLHMPAAAAGNKLFEA
jgi:hypothetical protein